MDAAVVGDRADFVEAHQGGAAGHQNAGVELPVHADGAVLDNVLVHEPHAVAGLHVNVAGLEDMGDDHVVDLHAFQGARGGWRAEDQAEERAEEDQGRWEAGPRIKRAGGC